jgi:hypothetical protein
LLKVAGKIAHSLAKKGVLRQRCLKHAHLDEWAEQQEALTREGPA